MGFSGGNKAASLGHENNEGRLSHICRLAGHVRAGYYHQTRPISVKVGVVADENAVSYCGFDYRMSSLFNGNHIPSVNFRTSVVVFLGNLCKGSKHIYSSNCGRCFLYFTYTKPELISHFAEQIVLQSVYFRFRIENESFRFLQLRCYESLAVYQSLLSDIVLRYKVVIGFGNLKIVTENLVESDLKVLYSCSLPL